MVHQMGIRGYRCPHSSDWPKLYSLISSFCISALDHCYRVNFAVQTGGTAIAKHCCKILQFCHKVFGSCNLSEAAGAPGTHPEPTVECQSHLIQSTSTPGITAKQVLVTSNVLPAPFSKLSPEWWHSALPHHHEWFACDFHGSIVLNTSDQGWCELYLHSRDILLSQDRCI